MLHEHEHRDALTVQSNKYAKYGVVVLCCILILSSDYCDDKSDLVTHVFRGSFTGTKEALSLHVCH